MKNTDRRRSYLALLQEQDDITMASLKYLLKTDELPDLENYICHCLNTILENNRALAFSIDRNFSMIAGSSLRNLLENWANIAYVLRKPEKTQEYATAITKTAFVYAATLKRLTSHEVNLKDLHDLPHWTTCKITDRVRQLGEAAEFQYELLGRYTHTDMWAAINDEMVQKEQFWTSLLGWGLEFSMETLLVVKSACKLPKTIDEQIVKLNDKIVQSFEE